MKNTKVATKGHTKIHKWLRSNTSVHKWLRLMGFEDYALGVLATCCKLLESCCRLARLQAYAGAC
jgi:hypothetical protein